MCADLHGHLWIVLNVEEPLGVLRSAPVGRHHEENVILLVVEERYRTRKPARSTARLQDQHRAHGAFVSDKSSSESIEMHVPSVDRSSDTAVDRHREFQCRVLRSKNPS